VGSACNPKNTPQHFDRVELDAEPLGYCIVGMAASCLSGLYLSVRGCPEGNSMDVNGPQTAGEQWALAA